MILPSRFPPHKTRNVHARGHAQRPKRGTPNVFLNYTRTAATSEQSSRLLKHDRRAAQGAIRVARLEGRVHATSVESVPTVELVTPTRFVTLDRFKADAAFLSACHDLDGAVNLLFEGNGVWGNVKVVRVDKLPRSIPTRRTISNR